jgi:cell division protein FtsW (lipid II flippase)/cell division protein FtsI/penicillin-binding protein 2
MAVTRSWERTVAVRIETEKVAPRERGREWPFLLGATLLVAWGLVLVFYGKTQNFAEQNARLAHGELLDLNAGPTADQIAPFLTNFRDPDERTLAAERVRDFLANAGPLPNVGALSKLRVSQSEIEADPRWIALREALAKRLDSKKPVKGTLRLPLLELARIKPTLVVRAPSEFTRTFAIWCAIYLAAFWIVHGCWRWRRFRGDPSILPALHLLTGIGLMLAISLRDPLRDSLDFKKFAWGCALGCALLLLPLLRAFQYRNFTRWVYTPLLVSFALFGLLLVAGSGPTGSDAKVNLGPFQPVELIKVLLVFFLAGYFSRRWEWLRELRERRLVPRWVRWPEIPRLQHMLPVMIGVAGALVLFFVLKDMGPALVLGFLFLSMFTVARGRFGLALFGVVLLVAGVFVGYRIGTPQTVVERIDMWLSPWDNAVHGGDQIAHALWAFSTGGPWGSGPGRGDPGMIPAGHTDLVLASIGEEWGILGTVSVFLLLGFLVYRAFRAARNAPDEYSTFLAFGLGALVALEMLLISGGVLDAIPLSGVVSPFLSSGNTAMLANFLIFAILLGISNHAPVEKTRPTLPFRHSMRVVALVLAGLGLALTARAAYFQVTAADQYLITDAKVFAEDGVKRPQHNPRLNSLMRQIPRGNIYDRNGVLLATSSWADLQASKADVQCCSPLESRHYPFGALTLQVLGDLRTGENFHATNASLIEHDSNARLQGYADPRDLAPLIRYRHYPDYPPLKALRDKDRSVRSSIDIRLQQKLAEIMSRRVTGAGTKGAAVVMDPATGDVLAMVSAPDESLDRARYGVYPPGSTFKLVTAIAALRKDAGLTKQTFSCVRLSDGRVGTRIPGWNRPIRDDIKDHAHGTLNLMGAITQSCNAYFAQLGVFKVGADQLRATAELLEIPPGDEREFRKMLPFSSYGQGPVLATPFKIARVAATISNGGKMPEGRWVIDESNARSQPPVLVLDAGPATFMAEAMRSVVTSGTGRAAMAGLDIPVAGKTGTAQVETGEPHSWFAGFAPYGDAEHKIAFAVVVEHGGYGAKSAAPIAREIVESARDLGIIPGKAPTVVSEKR